MCKAPELASAAEATPAELESTAEPPAAKPPATQPVSRCRRNLLEVWRLWNLCWPRSVTNLFLFAPRIVALALIGHLPGGAPLVAAGGIAIMYSNLSGNMFIKSTSFGIAGLYAQAFGAGNHRRVGQLLLRLLLLHSLSILLVSLPLTAAAERILLAVGQPPQVAADAQTFLWIRLMGLPFVTLTHDLTGFLVAQCCVRTPMVAGISSATLQV